MNNLYIFSKVSRGLSSVIKNTKGLYAVRGRSAQILSAAKVLKDAGWQEVHNEVPFDFISKIKAFLSSLNEVNSSRYWWTLNFTDKNPLASKFSDQVFFFCLIVQAFQDSKDYPVIVVTDDFYSISHLKAWAKHNDIKVIDRSKINFKWLVKHFTPIGPSFAFARAVIRHFYDAFVFRRERLQDSDKGSEIIFASLVSNTSFKGGKYSDVYFEPLLNYLQKNKKNYHIFSLIIGPYKSCVKKLIKFLKCHNFVTVNSSVSFLDLVKCFFDNLIRLYSPIAWSGENNFEGKDISCIIRGVIKEDICSTKYFTNSVFYWSALRLFNRVRPKCFVYPFEMHPWEKMMLIALKESVPKAQVVGYQHVAFTPRHLNLMFSEKERNVLPFPDKIITLGDVTKDIIVKLNPFLKDIVVSGCALRQSLMDRASVFSKESDLLKIAVIMASSLNEHIGLVKLANSCVSAYNGSCRFILRPHPTISLDRAIVGAGGLAKGCVRSRGQLDELLSEADMVMYTSSTVSIEALSVGKPVIYADIGDYMNSDPLFDYQGPMFRIENSNDFFQVVRSLKGMSEDAISEMSAKGIEYANKYFLSINDQRLEVFLGNGGLCKK